MLSDWVKFQISSKNHMYDIQECFQETAISCRK